MVYFIEKEEKVKKIGRKKLKWNGYSMKPKMKERDCFIEVKEITIVNPALKEKVLKTQFHHAFKRMLKLVINTCDDETSQGDINMALSELERTKKILSEKYKQELAMEDFLNMWKKVEYLESKLLMQIEYKRYIKEQNMLEKEAVEETKGRGR